VLSPAPVVQQAPFPPQPMQMQAPPRRQGGEHATPLLGAVDPPEAPVLVPMGTPVADAMPKLPAALSLNDPYSGFAYTTESADEGGSHHRAAFDASGGISDARGAPPPMGTPVFYSDEELAALNQQPFPADIYTAGVRQGGAPVAGQPLPLVAGVPVAESAQAVISQPVLTTAAGMPVVNTSVAGLSPARTCYDGWNGITSCDGRLQDSVDELMLFLNTHNTRPLVGCQVEGWHHERRTRRRRVVRDGKEHWETESHLERVRDFMYKVDLTPFVYPFGFIASVDADGLSVPDLPEVRQRHQPAQIARDEEGGRLRLRRAALDGVRLHPVARLAARPDGELPQGQRLGARLPRELALHHVGKLLLPHPLPRHARPVPAHAHLPRRLLLPRGPRRGGRALLLPHQLPSHPSLRGHPLAALGPGLLRRRDGDGAAPECLLVALYDYVYVRETVRYVLCRMCVVPLYPLIAIRL